MKSVGTIGLALGISSGLGVVLLALVARWLTLDENAAFVAIWGVVFSGASILSVIEQESARQVTIAGENARPVPASVGQLTLLALSGSVVILLLLSVLPFGRSVFGESLWLVALTFVALSGFAIQYLVRGVLLGRRRNAQYAVVIVAEAGLRVVAITLLMVTGVRPSVEFSVLAVVVGSFGWLPLIRPALGGISWQLGREPWRTTARRIALLALANGLLAMVLTGYPATITALLGTSEGLAIFFSVVTVSRVPLVLLSPVQALVVPTTTRALLRGEGGRLLRLQGQILLGIVSLAALGAAGGYLFDPLTRS